MTAHDTANPFHTKRITIDVDDFYHIVSVLQDSCKCDECKRIVNDILAQNRKQLRQVMSTTKKADRFQRSRVAWADKPSDAAAVAMLTKCIAVVEALHDYAAPTEAHKDALWNAMSALRALQED